METAAAPSASAALPSPSPARLHLLYFEGFRGRLEPVLLLLNDAGAAYSLTEVPLRDWPQLKQDSSRVPFGKLPVLKAAFGHEGKSNTIAETSAILRYLQVRLAAAKGGRLGPRCTGDATRARHGTDSGLAVLPVSSRH
jgi:glutathione S-transferase